MQRHLHSRLCSSRSAFRALMEAKKKILFNSLNKRQSYKEKFKTFWKKLKKKCKYIYIHEIHIDMYMKNKLEKYRERATIWQRNIELPNEIL